MTLLLHIELKQLRLSEKTATNRFVYWSDGNGGQAIDHHSRKGSGHFLTKITLRSGRLTNFFQMPGVYPGGEGMFAAGIVKSHIKVTVHLERCPQFSVCNFVNTHRAPTNFSINGKLTKLSK